MASDEKKDEWFKDSNMIFYLETTSEWLAGFLPQSTTEEADTARDLLEGMDILKSENEDEDEENSETDSGEIKNDYDVKDEGYDGSERKGLDRLIDELNISEEPAPENGEYNQ